jgi:hypothetical protein
VSEPSTPIEYLTEIKITWSELKLMPAEQRAFFALICMALNDIITFSRLVVLANWKPGREENIDVIAAIQKNSLLRVWSAKLFELSEAIENIEKKKKLLDKPLKEFILKHRALYADISELPGYFLARAIRNQASSHYGFSDIVRSLDHVGDLAKCGYLLHEATGNSCYPLGEEVAFVGQLNRHMSGTQRFANKTTGIEEWMDWNVKATRIANNLIADFNREFVKPILKADRQRLQRRAYWLDHRMVGQYGETMLPIFMRRRAP